VLCTGGDREILSSIYAACARFNAFVGQALLNVPSAGLLGRSRVVRRLSPELPLPETSQSDAGVPGIASFWSRGAQTLAKTFQTVGDREVGDEFHALVAELAG